MILVMYHAEQNEFRFYDTVYRGWVDMMNIDSHCELSPLVEWGWELIGEL